MGDCERDRAFDPLRRGNAGIVCDQGAPVVANQLHGSPRRPAVDQREHVAGEGCEVERPRGRGRRVTAKPGCDDVTSAAAELGKEGLRGRRMVREAVQDDRRLTIGITTLQRVKGAVWQVEGDVFELHVWGFSKSVRTRDADAGFGVFGFGHVRRRESVLSNQHRLLGGDTRRRAVR